MAAHIKKEQGQEASLLSQRSPQFLSYHLSTLFPQIAHTQLLAKLAVMLIAPDSASIAPQRTHFKFLITSPQMACYARLYFLTIPP